ncbi:hypothetical protein ACFQZV_10525 [Microbacterium koreense]|uniref:LPXTG cell wall anchor domain-containing protein n=1 Tax=Microbacterium koreense TaxID=323761 RepID=A0ABW2ZTY7_9MICO
MKRWGAVLLAAVIGGVSGIFLTGGVATATTMPLDVDFGVVPPGQERSAEREVVVPTDAVVQTAGWDARDGDGVWTADLCSAERCTSVDALAGAELAAGTYRLVVGVSIPWESDAVPTSADGHIALIELFELPLPDDGLAITGATVPWLAAGVGALALATGTAVLVRRRDREEADA